MLPSNIYCARSGVLELKSGDAPGVNLLLPGSVSSLSKSRLSRCKSFFPSRKYLILTPKSNDVLFTVMAGRMFMRKLWVLLLIAAWGV